MGEKASSVDTEDAIMEYFESGPLDIAQKVICTVNFTRHTRGKYRHDVCQ